MTTGPPEPRGRPGLVPPPRVCRAASAEDGVAPVLESPALERADRGLRTASVAPGASRAPIDEAAMRGDADRGLLGPVPQGRPGVADDAARPACRPVSDETDYVVGTALFVERGTAPRPGSQGDG